MLVAPDVLDETVNEDDGGFELGFLWLVCARVKAGLLGAREPGFCVRRGGHR